MTVFMTVLMSYLLIKRSIWFLLLVLVRVLTIYLVDIVSEPFESTDETYTEKVLINPENNMLTSTIFYTCIDLFLYTLYYINNTSF